MPSGGVIVYYLMSGTTRSPVFTLYLALPDSLLVIPPLFSSGHFKATGHIMRRICPTCMRATDCNKVLIYDTD